MLLIAWSFAKITQKSPFQIAYFDQFTIWVFGSNKKLFEEKCQNTCDIPLLNRSITYVPLLLLLLKASESESTVG